MSLAWAVFFMFFMIWIVSIAGLQGLIMYFEGSSEQQTLFLASGSSLNIFFGSLVKAMMSLFGAISGGVDWMEVSDALTSVHWFYQPVFVVYMCFMVFGVLNVFTGTFVDQSLQAAHKDTHNMMQVQLSERQAILKVVKDLFGAMGDNGSQMLTRQQFAHMLTDPHVIAYLRALDVNLNEARGMFELLDVDHSDTLSVEEFLNGCIRMKGGARAVDMVEVLYESKKMGLRLKAMRDETRHGFQETDSMIKKLEQRIHLEVSARIHAMDQSMRQISIPQTPSSQGQSLVTHEVPNIQLSTRPGGSAGSIVGSDKDGRVP